MSSKLAGRAAATRAAIVLAMGTALVQAQGPEVGKLTEAAPAPPPAPQVQGVAVPAVVSSPEAKYVPVAPNPDAVDATPSEVPKPLVGPGGPPNRQINDADSTAPEPATERAPKPGAPTPASTFDSTDFDTNATHTGGNVFIPPDPIAAAGPDHLVNVTNVTIRFHQKNGTLDYDDSINSFFTALSPVNFTFDPKVIYDQFAGRFVVVALEKNDTGTSTGNTSRILVAVSDDSDPVGTWHVTAINSKVNIAGVDHWADYPGLAVDEEAVYITANMFAFEVDGGTFGGNRLWIIDKGLASGLYAGGTASVAVYNPTPLGGVAGTAQPAHIFGAAPTNVGTWLSAYNGLHSGTNALLQLVRVDKPLGSIAFVGPTNISLGNIDDTAQGLEDAPQLGSTVPVEVNDRGTLSAVWRNNHLYVTTTVRPPTGTDTGQTTAHWIEVDTAPATPALLDQGNVGGEDLDTGAYTFFPAIGVNDFEDVVIGFAVSGPDIHPSSAYTSRQAGDPAGMNSGAQYLRQGTDYYIRTFSADACPPARNRWGDYSGIAVDPSDQCFWVYNQHAILRGTETAGSACSAMPPEPSVEDGRWGTAYGRVCFAPPDGTLLIALAGTGTGVVTSNPAGIDCGSTCSSTFTPGTMVQLTATPDLGSELTGWSGDADCSDGIVTVSTVVSCTATFDLSNHTLSVTRTGTGSGRVTSTPSGINCGVICSALYPHGTSVTLHAIANVGSDFAGWSGDPDCSDGMVTMSSDLNCTATFTHQTRALTVTKAGTGSGLVTSSPAGINCGGTCTHAYEYHTSVTLSATPSAVSVFAGWSGAADCSDGVVVMDLPTTCIATFDVAGGGIFADGFESGDTSAWSATVP